ncbi:MAG: hypothetical protein CMM48_11740 [Rhodospirillaceae bacterium]|nr:hypothetical protein [Rhodospirillaceae bacterium]|tara:strand:+ start:79 stop:213 length:135 start_codon:yes stop_codon:yes gene_type:complete
MSGEMQFKQAPKENLDTWALLVKMTTWSCIGIAALLVILAATLV